MKTYRIHGDNIVECERIANIIIKTLKPDNIYSKLISPSTVALIIDATYMDNEIQYRSHLLAGGFQLISNEFPVFRILIVKIVVTLLSTRMGPQYCFMACCKPSARKIRKCVLFIPNYLVNNFNAEHLAYNVDNTDVMISTEYPH